MQRHGVLMSAVKRQQGLTDFLGGSAILAMAMGADEEMTQPPSEPITLTVCDDCAIASGVFDIALTPSEPAASGGGTE